MHAVVEDDGMHAGRATMGEDTMDAGEAKCLQDIEQFGCHILHVLQEGELPPFSYSVGIERSSGQPEVIVIGLRRDLAQYMINDYCTRVRAGERFVAGQRIAGWLEGFDCEVRVVDPSHYDEYVGWDLWLYKGPHFRLVQLVYPTTTGAWPWDEGRDASFHSWQPLLDAPRLDWQATPGTHVPSMRRLMATGARLASWLHSRRPHWPALRKRR